MSSPIYNPSIPYVGGVPGGVVQPGALFRIQGTPHMGARCFAINFQCGPNMSPREDIALHLSPVFSPPPRVVRNTLQNQQWGPEESHGAPFPLAAGQGFEILVLAEAHEYKIAINGAHYTEFPHRIPLHRVSYIAIDGEVSITMLAFEGVMSGQSVPLAPIGLSAMPGGSLPPYPTSEGMPMPMPTPMAMPMSDSGRRSPYGDIPAGPPPQYAPPAYPQQPGYVGGYPQAPAGYPGGYPGAGYPPSSGTHFVPHPGSHKSGTGTGLGTGLAAGAAALAGGSLLKHGMHKKGLGPAIGGAALSSMLHSKGSHGSHHKSSSPLSINSNLGKGLAVGAGALAGAALLKHVNPLKPKKMKKVFKHKHKHGWGGWGSSSSSSSSSEEE